MSVMHDLGVQLIHHWLKVPQWPKLIDLAAGCRHDVAIVLDLSDNSLNFCGEHHGDFYNKHISRQFLLAP